MNKNQTLAARMSFGFILFLGTVCSFLNTTTLNATIIVFHIFAGLIGFAIFTRMQWRWWTLKHTATLTVFITFGILSLLALGCWKETKTVNE